MSAFPMNIRTMHSESCDLLLLSKGHYGDFNDRNMVPATRYILAQHLGLRANSRLLSLPVLVEKVAKAAVLYNRAALIDVGNDCRQFLQLLARFAEDPARGFGELYHLLTSAILPSPDLDDENVLPPADEALKDGLQKYLAWLKWFDALEIADDVYWTDPDGVNSGVYRLSCKHQPRASDYGCMIETPMGLITLVEHTDLSPAPASK